MVGNELYGFTRLGLVCGGFLRIGFYLGQCSENLPQQTSGAKGFRRETGSCERLFGSDRVRHSSDAPGPAGKAPSGKYWPILNFRTSLDDTICYSDGLSMIITGQSKPALCQLQGVVPERIVESTCAREWRRPDRAVRWRSRRERRLPELKSDPETWQPPGLAGGWCDTSPYPF